MASSKAKPWERKNPKGKKQQPLSPAQKKKAKDLAKKAGRKYPNLVDNMRVAAESRRRVSEPPD